MACKVSGNVTAACTQPETSVAVLVALTPPIALTGGRPDAVTQRHRLSSVVQQHTHLELTACQAGERVASAIGRGGVIEQFCKHECFQDMVKASAVLLHVDFERG